MLQKHNRMAGLDALRGVAAMTVVLYHVARHVSEAGGPHALRQVLQFGHAGVDLFFVISGFVIMTVHGRDIGHSAQFGRFSLRRFNRIAPPYWVALAVTVAMSATHGLPALTWLAWNATLLPTAGEPILGVAWTLQHEILFYAAFAVLIFNRRAGFVLFAAWAVAIVLALPWSSGVILSPYNAEFFFGMAAAEAVRQRQVPPMGLPVGVAIVVAVAVAEDLSLFDGYAAVGRLLYAIPSGLIVAGMAALDRKGRIVAPAWAVRLGRASYSIYLFQFIFIGLAWKAFAAHLPLPLAFIILALSAIGGGMAASALVERPVLPLRSARRQNSAG